MKTQEARGVPMRGRQSVGSNPSLFQPKALYLLLGMVLIIGLLGTFLTPHCKQDANRIVSPFDYTNAPPELPDRSAIVLPSRPKATPASQGAGAKKSPKDQQDKVDRR